ncbi:MAG: hypothetical protein WC764_04730 [Candidatus Paceibacterota bacterium]|jgi:hypothetical protein
MGELFDELFAVDSAKALEFFSTNLRAAIGERSFRENEIIYVANVLARYAQVSRFGNGAMPVLADLTEVFDQFVFQRHELFGAEILEIGGSQVLLFTGFFRDQMRRRHDVRWFDELGRSFYYQAGQFSKDYSRRRLFDGMSETFPLWTRTCWRMNRTLRQNQLLLKFDCY